MSKVEDIRNKFKVVRDLLVSLAAGTVVAVTFLTLTSKPDVTPKWEDNNDGRFAIKHTDKSGKVSYSDAVGYNILVDKATGVNYICYENGACSPMFSYYGKVTVSFDDIDWKRRD